jgi:hypothetical protein
MPETPRRDSRGTDPLGGIGLHGELGADVSSRRYAADRTHRSPPIGSQRPGARGRQPSKRHPQANERLARTSASTKDSYAWRARPEATAARTGTHAAAAASPTTRTPSFATRGSAVWLWRTRIDVEAGEVVHLEQGQNTELLT